MNPERWQTVQNVIDEFCENLSAGFPNLEIIHAYDNAWSKEEWNKNRLSGFSSKLRGVYLAFREDGRLEYIGVASNSFAKRVWSHNDWLEYRYIDVIPFQPKQFHFALALEYFLISKLKPKQNTAYKHHEL